MEGRNNVAKGRKKGLPNDTLFPEGDFFREVSSSVDTKERTCLPVMTRGSQDQNKGILPSYKLLRSGTADGVL